MRKQRGFTLLELLIVVVILGVLALIAAPTMLNAADKAKDGAVKANVSAAASTATTHLTVNEEVATDAAANSVNDLNAAGTPDDTADDAKSPYNKDVDAFVEGSTGSAGQVALDGDDTNESVTIIGFGKDASALMTKSVSPPKDASSSSSSSSSKSSKSSSSSSSSKSSNSSSSSSKSSSSKSSSNSSSSKSSESSNSSSASSLLKSTQGSVAKCFM